ncbi:MAG: hypothetical protein LBT16_06425 [Treponema sp.]|jgi:hypothetical protein|nr:hypothetical protein [Treponema sp.]
MKDKIVIQKTAINKADFILVGPSKNKAGKLLDLIGPESISLNLKSTTKEDIHGNYYRC